MPWKNSWFQVCLVAAAISTGLLLYDYFPNASTSMPPALPSKPSTPQVTSPPSSPPPSSPPQSSTPPVNLDIGPKDGQEYVNSLGAKFVSAGTPGVLFCVWDVRVKDFQAFVQAAGYQPLSGMWELKIKKNDQGGYFTSSEVDKNATWDNPGFNQSPEDPVVGVDWDTAIAFCRWLTKKERDYGKIGSGQMYRLPTDAEWSAAVRYGKYPWGDTWPPPSDAGNYCDQAWLATVPGGGKDWNGPLPENDGYAYTSPVGSYKPNAYGLYDMGGNVWQWCMDWYTGDDGGENKYRVLRGACWFNDNSDDMLSSKRSNGTPDYQSNNVGFRVVLVVTPPSLQSP